MATKQKPEKAGTKKGTKTENSAKKTSAQKTATRPKKPADNAKLKELELALQVEKDKYLRLSAEFDNYRKRTLKEKMDLTKLAGEDIFVKILPVLDDLGRDTPSHI